MSSYDHDALHRRIGVSEVNNQLSREIQNIEKIG